ncbi:MAG TPA: efflux RND transporter periplasmic adaptor subunit [Anaerolineales bacterium]
MFLLTRKIFKIAFLSLLFVLSVFLLGADMQAEAAPSDNPVPVEDSFQEAETGLRVEGRVVPRRFANLAMKLSGRVEEVLVREGDPVESGQVLLRLGDADRLLAEIAAAEMELLLAQQELQLLYQNADLLRAQAERELAGAQKQLFTAKYKADRLKQPPPRLAVDQAYANMLLAENALKKVRDELSRTERQFDDRNDPIWMFVNRRQVKLLLTLLERNVAAAQKRYEDSSRKYQDLIAPPDEIELAVAEADLAVAQARMADAEQKHAALIDGPDSDEVAADQARIRVAETALEASKKALQELELSSPFAGTVVDVSTKAGEWVEVGQPVVILAGLSEWIVETEDLTEIQVPELEVGQRATVNPEALPEIALTGTVESISGISELKRGDVTYTARILLDEVDSRLRWGMTVAVTFEE